MKRISPIISFAALVATVFTIAVSAVAGPFAGGGGSSGQAVNAMTDSWTNSGTTYDGIKLTITDTASAATSKVLNILGGASGTTAVFQVRKDGAFQTPGPFTLQFSDNTTTGGNARGVGAVDLQYSRTAATAVASGQNSFTAGYNNTASSNQSIAIGQSAIANSTSSIAIGSVAQSSATESVAIGYSAYQTAGTHSLALSTYYAQTTGTESVSIGSLVTDRGLNYAHFESNGQFSAIGDSQTGRYFLRKITTDNTTGIVLTADTGAAGATNQVVMPNNSVYTFEALITARRTDSADYGSWRIIGAIRRNANAAATALVGTPTVTVVGAPSGTWTAPAAVADTTNGGLQITVGGGTASTVRWLALVQTVEVTN